MALTKRDILTAALREIGAIDPTEAMSSEDSAVAEDVCDRLFDNWNAQRQAVYASQFATSVLTPNLSPHTIGPTGTIVVTQRPEEIEAAGLVIGSGSSAVRTPITLRDKAWYAGVSMKAIAMSIPTDLYYEKDWPLGKLFFYPVPDTAYSVELMTRMLLTALALDDTFTMPPGYRDAVVLTLAENCVTPFSRQMPQDLPRRASKARGLVFGNNRETPRIATVDAGMPGRRLSGKINPITREFV